MVSYYDKLRLAENQPCVPPVVAKLQGVFDALDDEELLTALKVNRKRSCKGYTVEALWRSYLMTYVLDIPGVAALIRRLQDNPALCKVCGLTPGVIPTESTYSRFISERLSMCLDLVQKTIHKAVDVLKEHLEDFGKIVAIDSTDIHAHSNGSKPEEKRSDKDASWGFKKKGGHDYWWYGYKAHMVCDATHELPIHVEITPANESDMKNLIGPLRNARVNPEYVNADAGYDALYNYAFVVDELRAIPLIDLNKRGKKSDGKERKPPKRTEEEIRLAEIRQNPGIARNSEEWDEIYDTRTSVERLFSRQKTFRRLDNLHYRSMAKVVLHVYLSTLSVVASAVSAIYSEQSESLRKVA
jgi:transposase